MENWIQPIVFGAAVVFFVLGIASLIVSFMLPTNDPQTHTQQKIEYRFFGIAGLIGFALMLYALL